MQIHSLDKATLINEIQLGSSVNQAVQHGRRSDFALMMSMFSSDLTQAVPVDAVAEQKVRDLRSEFELQEPQQLRSDENSYQRSAEQAKQFHNAGLSSAKLSHYLKPDALAYMPEGTHNLPEEVYHNLSNHERTKLSGVNESLPVSNNLYASMQTAARKQQLNLSI
ncbi:VC2046/SO_2500 family protein [Vibrio maerlii]|uniref:VC2046/SO_2500 family protein n=1 Tax=Vibrio maerlii TaxID=2231648 RepID=UPI000E3C5794|nr:VC2046/SO_2500 family protein [Vibrio maerlii]